MHVICFTVAAPLSEENRKSCESGGDRDRDMHFRVCSSLVYGIKWMCNERKNIWCTSCCLDWSIHHFSLLGFVCFVCTAARQLVWTDYCGFLSFLDNTFYAVRWKTQGVAQFTSHAVNMYCAPSQLCSIPAQRSETVWPPGQLSHQRARQIWHSGCPEVNK